MDSTESVGNSRDDISFSCKIGWDAALKAQAAQSSSVDVEFDEEAVYTAGYTFSKRNGPASAATKNEITQDFREGARWQFNVNRAALSTIKSELGQRSQATIDKAIAASKLPSDKPSIFADVEFVDNGNNSYLKSKGAAQTMALHILEEQIEKLRAENAILREALKEYCCLHCRDQVTNTCYRYISCKALTAADKVRSK